MVDRFITLLLGRPKLFMSLVLALVLVTAPGLTKFAEKYDVRIWFLETDPHIITLNRFERQFGNDENMVVALRAGDGLFTPEMMPMLVEISEAMWGVPEVLRVDSVTNYNMTRVDGDDILIEPLIDLDYEYTQPELDELKVEALAHRVIPRYLLSVDGLSAMIFAPLVPTLDGSPDYEAIVTTTREIVARYADVKGLEIHLIGEAAVNDAFREVSNDDSLFILPIMILAIMLCLWILFRSWWAIVMPMLVISFSNIITLGIAFASGFTYNQILSILPAILIAISIADSVHVMMTYFQYLGKGLTPNGATRASLEKNLVPTILTTVSTSIGFISLTVTDLLPVRELGLLAALGCVMAWVVTIFFICPMMSILAIRPAAHFTRMKEVRNSSKKADAYIAWVRRWQNWIIAFFTGVIATSLVLTTMISVNSNPYDYFTDGISIRKANTFVEKHFGGNAGPELLISSGRADGIKDPDFLRQVEKLKTWLDELPFVNKTIDVIDIIKDINMNLNGGDESFYRIPDTQEEVAQQLFFYSLGLPAGMDLNNRMSLDFESMRMTVLWSIFDTRGWLKHVAEIEEKAQELGLTLETTGKFLLFQRMMDYVVMTFFTSVLMAMMLVALLMSVLFRSIKLGLLSLIPNILPLLIGAGFMYVTGIDLNIGSAIVASVCLGIAIDDTIHFLSHYYRLRRQGLSQTDTMTQIITFTGSALVSTTGLLVLCFGLYMLGDFTPMIDFGMLCAVVLVMALLIDLMFLPAVLMKLEGVREGRHDRSIES
jgi:uncharacterized protein